MHAMMLPLVWLTHAGSMNNVRSLLLFSSHHLLFLRSRFRRGRRNSRPPQLGGKLRVHPYARERDGPFRMLPQPHVHLQETDHHGPPLGFCRTQGTGGVRGTNKYHGFRRGRPLRRPAETGSRRSGRRRATRRKTWNHQLLNIYIIYVRGVPHRMNCSRREGDLSRMVDLQQWGEKQTHARTHAH